MRTVDFTKFTKDGSETLEAAKTDKRWWIVQKEDRAAAVSNVVLSLIRFDSVRQSQYQLNAKLYGNVDYVTINSLTRNSVPGSGKAIDVPVARGRSQFNIVQSGIDTLVSKQAKNKPKPLFLTSGGDWKTQRKAKKLDKFVDGIFYENDVYSLNNEIRRDAYVFGDGLVQVFPLHGRVKFERVMASDLLVDWVEALDGSPRQLHRPKNVDRDVLCDLYPKRETEIRNARSISAELAGTYQNVADQITVVESWHLPSGPDAGDGIHTINIISVTADGSLVGVNLLDEEWKKDFFPFAQRRWNKRLKGHWSQGIPEQIEGTQLELNKLLWMMSRSYHMAGTFKIWLKTGSKVPKGHINNEIGTVIVGDEKPEYLLCPPVLPEHIQRVKDLRADGFDQIGISQLSAAAQKPAGLDSGKALRTYNDIESERFMSDGQEEERFVLQLGKLTVDCAIDIYKDKKSYDVRVPGRKFIQTIDWKDIALEPDGFILKMFPVSSLPTDPSGRLAYIQERIQSGMLDPVTGRRLMDFPDDEQQETLANAQEEWINMALEKIVDDNEYTPPEPEMDLKLAKWFCLMYIAQGYVIGLPEERLANLRLWNSALDNLEAKALPPPMPAPMAGPPGGGAPQAAPMAPPQSNLIPNVPAMAGATA